MAQYKRCRLALAEDELRHDAAILPAQRLFARKSETYPRGVKAHAVLVDRDIVPRSREIERRSAFHAKWHPTLHDPHSTHKLIAWRTARTADRHVVGNFAD